MPRMTIFRSRVLLAVGLLGAAVGPLSTAVAQATDKPRTYTVKAGDTLFSIARALYGDQAMWAQIYRLNTRVIEDPHWIYPGEVLTLVATEATRAVPAEATPPPEPQAPEVRRPEPEPARPAAAPPQPERPEIKRPEVQPERPVVIVEEPPVQEPVRSDSLFAKRRGIDAYTALRSYREQPYRPLRRAEFYSSGFLTEDDQLPFGRLLGSVTPQQIRNLSERATVNLYSSVGIAAPKGGRYEVGDSLLLVQVFPGPSGYGDIVFPTGMARVTGQNGDQAVATIVAVYATIRNGHLTLPTEVFVQGGTSRAQPIDNGVGGTVLGQRETRELKHPQNVLFLSVGKRDGVARGDLFEVRRDPGPRVGTSDTVDELMALLQVVHVRERSATARILNVVSPDIPPGTRVKQVAKLPS